MARSPQTIGLIVLVCATVLFAGTPIETTWSCGSNDWDQAVCWDVLQPPDQYPDSDGGSNYDVLLPQGAGTITVDIAGDPSVTINGLVVEPSNTLDVQAGMSFAVVSSLTAHATLRSWGVLSAEAGAVIDIDESSLYAQMAGSISLPATGYVDSPGCSSEVLRATGGGSLLDLSSLTSLDASSCGSVSIQALDGGTLDLSALSSVTGSALFTADGVLSTLQLDTLTTLGPDGSLRLDNGGTVIAPLTTLEQAALRLDGAGNTIDLTGITDIAGSDIQAYDGGVLALPAVTTYTASPGCASEVLRADGSGSLVDLSFVISFDASGCGVVSVQAWDGGTADLSNLPTTSGAGLFSAEGSASTLQLDVLTTIGPADGSLTVANGGTVVAALTAIQEGGLTLDGVGNTVDLTQITDIDGSDLSAENGAVLALPAVTSYFDSPGCASETLRADGAGSVLDLSSVTDLDASGCSFLFVQALDGGLIDLSNIQPTTVGGIDFTADGPQSTLLLDTVSTIGPVDASITVANGGTVVAAPLTAVQQGALSLDGVGNSIDLTQVSDIDGSDFVADNGAVLALPAATSYVDSPGCASEFLRADQSGSLLDLSALTSVDASGCGILFIQATENGIIDLSAATVFGDIYVASEGPDSSIQMDNLDMASGDVSVIDGGTLILSGSFSHEITFANGFTWSADATLRMIGAAGIDDADYCQFETLEVAGEDFGPGTFANNFELGNLVIGADAHVSLVDCVDNMNGGGPGGSAEALYVDSLELESGAVLDLNGLHLYTAGVLTTAGPFGAGTIINAVSRADLNQDCAVDAGDLAQVLGSWGPCPEPCTPDDGQPNQGCDADFNDDCVIDASDLAQVLGAWGPACASAVTGP